MERKELSPPPAAMRQFKQVLGLAQDAEQGRTDRADHQRTFDARCLFLGMAVEVVDKHGHVRHPRAVLNEVMDVLVRRGSEDQALKDAVDLFGEEHASATVEALRPIGRTGFEIRGVDVVYAEDEPSYARALRLMRGPPPNAFTVWEALGDASPDGPQGNIWEMYDEWCRPN